MSAALRERIAELEAENAELRDEIGLREERIPALQAAFGLQVGEARTLSHIMAGKGRWVLRDHIEASLPTRDRERDRKTKIVHVYVSRLRNALGRESVLGSGMSGFGAYRLSDDATAKILEAISE
jgi:DNA-binding response OmpR family regulator